MSVPTSGLYMRISEAAEYLHISERTMKRLISERQVVSYSIAGNLTLLKKNEIDEYVETKRRAQVCRTKKGSR